MEKETQQESALPAVLGTNDVPKMLEQVTAQIKLIKGNLPKTPKTDGNLQGFGKVEDINSLESIIKAASMVIGKERSYKEAAEIMIPKDVKGVKVPAFRIGGMKAQDVLDHLKVRAVEVGNKEKLDKLNKIKKELEANLSAEAKLANSLSKIKGILSDEEGED
jgi:hypothetical protein